MTPACYVIAIHNILLFNNKFPNLNELDKICKKIRVKGMHLGSAEHIILILNKFGLKYEWFNGSKMKDSDNCYLLCNEKTWISAIKNGNLMVISENNINVEYNNFVSFLKENQFCGGFII